jgi:hypothetical protein
MFFCELEKCMRYSFGGKHFRRNNKSFERAREHVVIISGWATKSIGLWSAVTL